MIRQFDRLAAENPSVDGSIKRKNRTQYCVRFCVMGVISNQSSGGLKPAEDDSLSGMLLSLSGSLLSLSAEELSGMLPSEEEGAS